MVRATGRYRNNTLELDQPLALAEGTSVELDIYLTEEVRDTETDAWAAIGMDRLAYDWDNPGDATYDNWKGLYGL
jgi:hypothetical protein